MFLFLFRMRELGRFWEIIPSTQVPQSPVLLLASSVLGLLQSHPEPSEARAACRIAGEVFGLRIQRWPAVAVSAPSPENTVTG